MYELKNGKAFTSKFVGTGPSCYENRIYRAAVSQSLRNTGLENHSLVYSFFANQSESPRVRNHVMGNILVF